jgi:hypothetical protein
MPFAASALSLEAAIFAVKGVCSQIGINGWNSFTRRPSLHKDK